MDVSLQHVAFQWACPMPEADMPDEICYRAVLAFQHGAGPGAPAALADALRPLAGRVRRMSLPLYGSRLRTGDPEFTLNVRVRGDNVVVKSAHRLRPAALRRLVQALAQVPGARGLELHAEVPRFSKAFDHLRACTPCQARRF